MPRNGSGSYSLPELPFTPGTTISSAAVNDDLSDIASALTGSVSSDGQTPITGSLQGTTGSVTAPSYSYSSEKTTGIYLYGAGQLGFSLAGALAWILSSTGLSTSAGMSIAQPVGSILDYAGSTAPVGWLLCYGQAINRTTYARLFAVIGTTYGSGDGSTTFNLPDLRGRVIPGKDDMGGTAASRITTAGCGIDGTVLGAAGGLQTNTLVTANLPPYTPSGAVHGTNETGIMVTAGVQSGPTSGGNLFIPAVAGVSFTFTGNAQGGTSTPVNDVQPSMILNKIIFAGV